MHAIKQTGMMGGLAGLVLGLVVACGGGGGSFAGIDRLGVTTGTINGFGSVIVNGIEYETDNAEFDVDDGPGGQDDLLVGQQVTIEWEGLDDGVTRRATSVRYDDTVEGTIQGDPTSQSMVVLGQLVIVDAATSFDDEIIPRDLSGLFDGDQVKVSGFIDADGNVRATRVDLSENPDEFEIRGVVAGLDTLSETFVVNGLTVDYSDLLGTPEISDGDFVEVEGDSFDGTKLMATKVELEDEGISGVGEIDDGEVEGYITAFSSATNFAVAGVPVTTNGQTTFEDGAFDPVPSNNINLKVEVEGEVNASGVLVARKVEFKSGDDDGDGDDDSIDGRVEGDVTVVNAGAGTLSVAGVAITVTAATRLEDQTRVVGQSFGLDDVSVGDYVKVRGEPGAGATLTALILERDESDPDGLVRGAVTDLDVNTRTMRVLGVPVNAATAEYFDESGTAINDVTFFTSISVGSEVKVKFTQPAGAVILADEVQLQDD